MPRGSTLAEVPIESDPPWTKRSLWSRGWESNPLQPSNPGCLLRVATRCFCSPSPEPIGLRWTSQPRPRPPDDSDRTCQNRISLLKIKDAQILTIRVSPSKLPLPLVLQLLLCGHSRSVVFLF